MAREPRNTERNETEPAEGLRDLFPRSEHSGGGIYPPGSRPGWRPSQKSRAWPTPAHTGDDDEPRTDHPLNPGAGVE